MKKLSIAALAFTLIAVGAIAFAPDAGAQTAPSSMTVDGVSVTQPYVDYVGFTVTGVRAGQVTATSTTISIHKQDPFAAAKFEACHKMLLLALSRPGQYVLRTGTGSPNGDCAVALIAP